MNGFFSSSRFKVLLIILFLILGFTIGAATSGLLDGLPSTVVNFVTAPIESVVTGISNGVTEFLKKFTRAEALYEENLVLKQEKDDLIEQFIDYETIKKENERLKELLEIQEADDDRVYVSGMVVEMDPENAFHLFTIDKGSMDGISIGDPVIENKSLVGEVVSVTSGTATVRTILDPKIKLGAYSVKSEDKGLISGNSEIDLDGFTRMNNIPNTAEIVIGDSVITTGVSGGTYPKDIKIGTIESVHKESTGTSQYAIIKPYVNIAEIKNVFVIIDFKGKGADAVPIVEEEDDSETISNESETSSETVDGVDEQGSGSQTGNESEVQTPNAESSGTNNSSQSQSSTDESSSISSSSFSSSNSYPNTVSSGND